MRDPVERIASNFYYMRSRSRWDGKDFQLAPDKSWFNKTIDECVFNNDPECMVCNYNNVYIHFEYTCFQIGDGVRDQEYQMSYFCDCRERNMTEQEMLMTAMLTVEKEFSVVGVLEMFIPSLHVMEAYLPGKSSCHLSP